MYAPPPRTSDANIAACSCHKSVKENHILCFMATCMCVNIHSCQQCAQQHTNANKSTTTPGMHKCAAAADATTGSAPCTCTGHFDVREHAFGQRRIILLEKQDAPRAPICALLSEYKELTHACIHQLIVSQAPSMSGIKAWPFVHTCALSNTATHCSLLW